MATLVELAAQVVSSHASSTSMTTDQIIGEISKVHTALKKLEAGESVLSDEPAKPSIAVKDAFKKGEVVCMVCGKGGFKTLARHLSTFHNMKPSEYRKQFGIPAGTPLVAKAYADARRKMAIDRGLADNLAKARAVRMSNIAAKKAGEGAGQPKGKPRTSPKAGSTAGKSKTHGKAAA